jgi:DNA ligase (NAD+)
MNREEAKQRIQTLTKELREHNYRYYVLSEPLISDYDFDIKLSELEQLEKANPDFAYNDSPTKRVGGDIVDAFTQVQHKYPMLSLANTYNEEELTDFHNRIVKLIPEPITYVCELKFDGVAISITYENGKLLRAVTRGDGIKGDDVTSNVKTIQSIPLVLRGDDHPDFFEIRGEIIMNHKSFSDLNAVREENNQALFANPRNAASGTLKMLDSAEVSKRKLDCYFYIQNGENLPTDSHYANMRKAKDWGFKVSDFMVKCDGINTVLDYIKEWERQRKSLDFEIDGVVIKMDSVSLQNKLGFTAKSPRWAISYKFKAERKATILQKVSYQLGRTGTVTPVADLSPVQLAGTIVKRATLHNADIIDFYNLHEKDTVFVEKGGEIIPKIVGVDTDKRASSAPKISFITHCPECNTPLVRKEGESAHYCPNDFACPPQIKGRIEHFIGRKAMNIDSLGEGKIEILYDNGIIHNPADIYDIKAENILGISKTYINEEGEERIVSFREKGVENIISGIEASKSMPFDKVLFALGIRYVGETVSRKLCRHFHNIEALMQASFEDLILVDEIGERIASSLINYFAIDSNRQMIQRLINHGLQFSYKEDAFLSQKLQGKSFVISGVFNTYSRTELKTLIEKHGGKNVSSISSKTDYIIAGENMGPSKLKKANELSVTIISEEDFTAMIV